MLRAAAVSFVALLQLSRHALSRQPRRAQTSLGLEGLPEAVTPELLESDTFLRAFHHVLLEARTLSHLARATPDAAARCTSRKASWCAQSRDIASSSGSPCGEHAASSVCAHAGALHVLLPSAAKEFPTCCSQKTRWQRNRSVRWTKSVLQPRWTGCARSHASTGTKKRSIMQFSIRLVPRQTAGFMCDSYVTQSFTLNSGAAAPGA